jgi:hypothetical protein
MSDRRAHRTSSLTIDGQRDQRELGREQQRQRRRDAAVP